MKSKNFVSYIFVVIALSGCIKVKKKSVETQAQVFTAQTQPELVKVLSRDQIKTTYIPTAKPNTYNVALKWPKFDGFIKILNKKIIA